MNRKKNHSIVKLEIFTYYTIFDYFYLFLLFKMKEQWFC